MGHTVQPCQILIVEDDPKLAGVLREQLDSAGYHTDFARTGQEALSKISEKSPDLILLDVMLPDSDGVDLCRQFRRDGVSAPILLLTALGETSDKVIGLNAGADDYLPKPFEIDELLARIRSLVRRNRASEPAILKYHDVVVDLPKRTVARDGEHIKLTTKEFELLEFLMRNPDRVLSRTAIAERVWKLELDSDSNVIDVYISTLRRKVDKPFDTALIHTVVGTGYILSITGPPV